MLRLVVLISGGGSNLLALLEACEQGDFPARVVAVGGDREADGFEHAERFGIPTFSVAMSTFADRDAWGGELLTQIRMWQPDLMVLSGFMKLLPHELVAALSPHVINTHPAYLPEFPGAHAVRDALAAEVEHTGASVIVVDDGVDTGPIIAQERVAVHPGDTEETLHERIKDVERRLLIDSVREIAMGEIKLTDVAHPDAAHAHPAHGDPAHEDIS